MFQRGFRDAARNIQKILPVWGPIQVQEYMKGYSAFWENDEVSIIS